MMAGVPDYALLTIDNHSTPVTSGSLPNLLLPPLSLIPHEDTRFVAVINDKLRCYGKLRPFALSEADLIDFSADKDCNEPATLLPAIDCRMKGANSDVIPTGAGDSIDPGVLDFTNTHSDPDIDFPRRHFGDNQVLGVEGDFSVFRFGVDGRQFGVDYFTSVDTSGSHSPVELSEIDDLRITL